MNIIRGFVLVILIALWLGFSAYLLVYRGNIESGWTVFAAGFLAVGLQTFHICRVLVLQREYARMGYTLLVAWTFIVIGAMFFPWFREFGRGAITAILLVPAIPLGLFIYCAESLENKRKGPQGR